MVSKAVYILAFVLTTYSVLISGFTIQIHNHSLSNSNSNGSHFAAMVLPEHNFNVNTLTSSTTGCTLSTSHHNSEESHQIGVVDFFKTVSEGHVVKVPLKQRTRGEQSGKDSVIDYAFGDLKRISTFRRRIIENKNRKAASRVGNHRHLLEEHRIEPESSVLTGQVVGNLKSGVSLGSGEYFMDVYVGTPPKHYLLIVDTGSDLNWIQCVPCYDCFEQNGPYYDPNGSSSFKNISCHDSRCDLVTSPDPPKRCKGGRDQSCPYYYWYGDSSNTTGDFSLETFTVNLTTPDGKSEFKKVENVMFGCGHWNRGLFHGAAGLLGLGRGPVSFSSQLQSLYGHSFSYCLVDRNSDPTISSKLIFGVDKALLSHPELNFTKLVNGKDNPVDTFYYVEIRSVIVGGETLKIPEETWNITQDGGGGTIVDSGTTLSYFVEPAYEIIKEAFIKKIKYSLVSDFPVLTPCYNVSGSDKLDIPDFKIRFSDGAIWNFPIQNYFIWIDSEIVCLAMLGTKKPGFSIIGNYQQQNFHVMYDTKNSRLGFAPTRCADV